MSHVETLSLDGAEITVARWGDGPTEIVMLHDGLGSIDQWRKIPASIAEKTRRTVMAYDRPGHGASTPVPSGPWPADWLHFEAARLGHVLDALEIENPLIVGHSDGGSIGLLYVAETERPIRGLLTLAAHSWVEQTCFDAITGMRENKGAIVSGLSRNNANPAELFEAWSGVWVSDAFRPWDIRPLLSTIDCPTVIAQGANDEYAQPEHAIDTAAAIGENAEYRLLDGVGHLLHHQDPDMVVDLVAEFDRAIDQL